MKGPGHRKVPYTESGHWSILVSVTHSDCQLSSRISGKEKSISIPKIPELEMPKTEPDTLCMLKSIQTTSPRLYRAVKVFKVTNFGMKCSIFKYMVWDQK